MPATNSSTATDELRRFGELLTANQSRLYAFIMSVVGHPETALEVFQESNLVLWRKADVFDHDREFLPWAFAIAKNQVLAARKRKSRDRLLFDESTINSLCDAAAERSGGVNDRQRALSGCLERLTPAQRQLIEQRYQNEEKLESIATSSQRTATAIGVALFRIRQSLADCIGGRLIAGTA